MAACSGESTRRDTTGAGGDAGAPSTGGTTSTGGAAGSVTSGTDSGGTNASDLFCEQLSTVYEAALEVAKICNPAQSSPRCNFSYQSSLPCGCPTFANLNPELDRLRAAWGDNGCPQPPCPSCDPPTGAYCSESGGCEDTWTQPPDPPYCDPLLLTPSPVCDYGVPCLDDGDCVHDDCYVPGSGSNPVCSRRCNTANDCPADTACIEVDGVDSSHCFVRCTSDDACGAINDAPDNPLVCVSFGAERVCIQQSEP